VIPAASRELLPTVLAAAIKGLALRRIGDNAALDPREADALVSLILDGARR
jgi:hypothetical protein